MLEQSRLELILVNKNGNYQKQKQKDLCSTEVFHTDAFCRRDKCQSCHYILHEIRLAMEEQLKTSTDSSLRQAYDDNLRLLNACERS